MLRSRVSGNVSGSRLRPNLSIHLAGELFAGLERDCLAGCDFDGLAGFRVTSGACLLFLGRKTTESAKINLLSFGKGFAHLFEDGVEHNLQVFLGMAGSVRDGVDQLSLGHRISISREKRRPWTVSLLVHGREY